MSAALRTAGASALLSACALVHAATERQSWVHGTDGNSESDMWTAYALVGSEESDLTLAQGRHPYLATKACEIDISRDATLTIDQQQQQSVAMTANYVGSTKIPTSATLLMRTTPLAHARDITLFVYCLGPAGSVPHAFTFAAEAPLTELDLSPPAPSPSPSAPAAKWWESWTPDWWGILRVVAIVLVLQLINGYLEIAKKNPNEAANIRRGAKRAGKWAGLGFLSLVALAVFLAADIMGKFMIAVLALLSAGIVILLKILNHLRKQRP